MPVATSGFSALPDSDATCAGCNYCLHGQSLTGACPECGLSVAASAARVADARTAAAALVGDTSGRRRSDMRAGPWLLMAALACVWLQTFLPPDVLPNGWIIVVRLSITVAAWILAISGMVVAVRPPRDREPEVARILRLITVTASLVAAGGLLIAWISASRMIGFSLLIAVSYIFSTLATMCFYLYAADIARRRGQRLAGIICILIVSTSLVMQLIGLGIQIMPGTSGRTFRTGSLSFASSQRIFSSTYGLESAGNLARLPIPGIGQVGILNWPGFRFSAFGALEILFSVQQLIGGAIAMWLPIALLGMISLRGPNEKR